MIRVLFICLGNICRSPMAEAIFRDLVKKDGLSDRIVVDSAGIGSWHSGEGPHEGTRSILDRQRIPYDGMTSRQIHKQDFFDFNYLIAMDDQNVSALQEMEAEKEGVTLAKLMDFVDEVEEKNVPDPYFTGNFDYTYELVSKGCSQLLNYIRKTNSI
ncbi:low molecular weight phosphotyrosine protein phosphatase [Lentibacillus cibarius]|uniref:protein-tyrosine-phosphatase n=1 Tax=Lentibacillus cibarius TaxID=2583219 RepID=A0A549YIA2_9BACI|nr:low molecular weight protein-tyrosine-phosphatase [Lentibacillus cibarius]TRM11615.1 low molecular weight phosphotyrosine protein phosphatase [Lentibacillus cibarius]